MGEYTINPLTGRGEFEQEAEEHEHTQEFLDELAAEEERREDEYAKAWADDLTRQGLEVQARLDRQERARKALDLGDGIGQRYVAPYTGQSSGKIYDRVGTADDGILRVARRNSVQH